ncbi:MAG TPA: radical SAM protein, partial [Aurantimonas sp.]|nr:radical SAM protein [Aurantimonas sp.]
AFATTVRLENVHPLQGGLVRLKRPSERRPEMAREHPLLFWPRFAAETSVKHLRLGWAILRLTAAALWITRDPATRRYRDRALTPVTDDSDEALDLFTKTAGGHASVAHTKKVAQLTGAGRAA